MHRGPGPADAPVEAPTTAVQPDVRHVVADIDRLWAESTGDPRVCVAILDGPVDASHPSLIGADLEHVTTPSALAAPAGGMATRHGTYVASIVFGRHGSPVTGVAPSARGLVIPIFGTEHDGALVPCSQSSLASALLLAVERGAHVVNMSGGHLLHGGHVDPELRSAVQRCVESDVLLIAAAGNEGSSDCHVPAALPDVLAVGAENDGRPASFSNWGEACRAGGILAPGVHVLGAGAEGTVAHSGTSAASAIVSGAATLLLSILHQRGARASPRAVGAVLLRTATPCPDPREASCSQFLSGTLDLSHAFDSLPRGEQSPMSEPTTDLAQPSTSEATTDVARLRPAPADIRPSACGCGGSKGSQPSFVYALGRVGYDFFSRSRQASLIQQAGKNLNDPTVLLEYLDHHEWDGASIQWVFELNETPIFIVRPAGAFADRAHAGLRRFLRQQLTEGVERVAIGGTVTGEGNLLDGRTLPVLWPDIRSMYSWTTDGLLKAVLAATPKAERSKELEGRVRDFLDRVYYQLRNLGVAPQDRAINYAATNALRVADVFRQALAEHMELDTIEVERSPVAPTDSDSWDVKMTFFDPKHRLEKARRVFRMTIDVSDTVPFNRGDARSWYVY